MKEIKLSKGFVAIVDDEDYEYLSEWKWSACVGSKGDVYAWRKTYENKRQKMIWMHKFIMGINDRTEIDHVDRNSLNNCRNNLRIADRSQNSINRKKSSGKSSRFKGVTWDRDTNKWRVLIKKNGVNYRIGRFINELDAATAYNKKAVELHGEFANLNEVA